MAESEKRMRRVSNKLSRCRKRGFPGKRKPRNWRNDVQRCKVIKTTATKMPTVSCKKFYRPGVRIRVCGWWNMTKPRKRRLWFSPAWRPGLYLIPSSETRKGLSREMAVFDLVLGRTYWLLRWGWISRRQNQENWFDNHCKDPGKREMVMGGGEPRQGREGRDSWWGGWTSVLAWIDGLNYSNERTVLGHE